MALLSLRVPAPGVPARRARRRAPTCLAAGTHEAAALRLRHLAHGVARVLLHLGLRASGAGGGPGSGSPCPPARPPLQRISRQASGVKVENRRNKAPLRAPGAGEQRDADLLLHQCPAWGLLARAEGEGALHEAQCDQHRAQAASGAHGGPRHRTERVCSPTSAEAEASWRADALVFTFCCGGNSGSAWASIQVHARVVPSLASDRRARRPGGSGGVCVAVAVLRCAAGPGRGGSLRLDGAHGGAKTRCRQHTRRRPHQF